MNTNYLIGGVHEKEDSERTGISGTTVFNWRKTPEHL